MLAALVIGGVVGAIVGKRQIKRGEDRFEVARRRVESQDQRADLGPQEMIGAGRPERREGFEIAGIDELQHGRRVGEVSDLALRARYALANGWQQGRGDVASIRPRQGVDARAPESVSMRICAEPSGGLVDHFQRRAVAILRGRPPGEQAVAAEHDASHVRIGFGHRAELQAEVETWPLPRQKTELPAINLARQRVGVLACGDRDNRVGVNVVDMRVGNEAVQGGVDRRRARIEVECAVIEQSDHLVLMHEATIDRTEAEKLVEVERRETIELHRADVAARALDPKDFRRRAGQRIGGGQLRRRVPAAEIRDPEVATEQVGPIEQQAGSVEGSRAFVVPQIGQRSVKTNMIAAHGSFLSMPRDFHQSICK